MGIYLWSSSFKKSTKKKSVVDKYLNSGGVMISMLKKIVTILRNVVNWFRDHQYRDPQWYMQYQLKQGPSFPPHTYTTHTPSLINFKKKKKKIGSLLNICVFLITNDSTSKLKNISFLFLFLYFYLVNSLIAIYFFLKKKKKKESRG